MTREELDKKIIEIGNSYHERMCSPSFYGEKRDRVCGCCQGLCRSVTCIEHDSQDYSKDLWICSDCLIEIFTYWKVNKPRKIVPF